MDEPQKHHTKSEKKPVPKDAILYETICMKGPELANLQRQKVD